MNSLLKLGTLMISARPVTRWQVKRQLQVDKSTRRHQWQVINISLEQCPTSCYMQITEWVSCKTWIKYHDQYWQHWLRDWSSVLPHLRSIITRTLGSNHMENPWNPPAAAWIVLLFGRDQDFTIIPAFWASRCLIATFRLCTRAILTSVIVICSFKNDKSWFKPANSLVARW